ncbi:ferritin-like domain-containing protein [soil metagenome]
MPDQKSKLTAKATTRRKLLQLGGSMALIRGLTFPAATPASASTPQKFPDDLAILNVALGLEHEAVAAYQAGAESRLLTGQVLETALSFQKDHKHHRDAIIKLIKRYGGTAVEPKPGYDFGVIKTAEDILGLAHKLEQGAVEAYLANAAKLQNRIILNDAAAILVDEVRHATVLKLALGLPVT